jgi:hypothetical protein
MSATPIKLIELINNFNVTSGRKYISERPPIQ